MDEAIAMVDPGGESEQEFRQKFLLMVGRTLLASLNKKKIFRFRYKTRGAISLYS